MGNNKPFDLQDRLINFSLGALFLRLAVTVALYAAAVGLSLLALNQVEVFDVMTVTKIVSLIALVIANGEVFKELKGPKYQTIRGFNAAILLVTGGIIIILLMKLVGENLQGNLNVNPSFLAFLSGVMDYSSWIAITPLVFYFAVDLYIYKNDDLEADRHRAKMHILFNDIVCLMPLILIAIGAYMALMLNPDLKPQVEMLVNSVVVSTIFGSAAATKAIGLLYDK